ncbi:DUF1642 domain-containing protein [Enterococcus avium]|uniref:DUF1642 domain-containing protein n=1 Tax=Enterococcus avium TaxID=33945 RepID=UPI0035CA0478
MNKQELIERLNNKLDETFAFQQSFKPLTWTHMECESKVNAYMTAINYVEQLDEPQKVKVPEFVVEWFEENKHNLNFAIYELCEAGKVPVDLYEGLTDFERWFYLNHDIDTLIRMQDGYEVEEEPKWKIINDQKYCLTSIEAGYCNSLHWAFDSTKKKPILFDNEEAALYTAYITGGTVVKAWV